MIGSTPLARVHLLGKGAGMVVPSVAESVVLLRLWRLGSFPVHTLHAGDAGRIGRARPKSAGQSLSSEVTITMPLTFVPLGLQLLSATATVVGWFLSTLST